MESRHSVQSTSVSYGGIGEIQKDVPNSRKQANVLQKYKIKEIVYSEVKPSIFHDFT